MPAAMDGQTGRRQGVHQLMLIRTAAPVIRSTWILVHRKLDVIVTRFADEFAAEQLLTPS